MVGNPARPSPARRVLAPLVLVSAMGCAATETPSEPGPSEAGPTTSVAATPIASEAGGETVALDPGSLEPGTRYVIENLGISLQPDVTGWFAVMPQGGDVGIAREGVTVYILAPETVLAPDGTQTAVPSDPQAFLDAVDATGIVGVAGTEPFEAGGLTGISAELAASGGSASAPLLTTGSGEYGLSDGDIQWIVVAVDGAVRVLSLERPDDPDIDAAWAVAGPLVESLELAP